MDPVRSSSASQSFASGKSRLQKVRTHSAALFFEAKYCATGQRTQSNATTFAVETTSVHWYAGELNGKRRKICVAALIR
jgi:hypothetical protein